MTAFDCHPGLAAHRKSPSRRSVPRRRLGLALSLALVIAACSSELAAPFVQLSLTGLPPSAVRLEIDVKLGSVTKSPTPQFQGDQTSLAQVTLSFPPASFGTLTLAVRARDASTCIVAIGLMTVELAANQIYPVTIPLTAMTPMGSCQGMTTIPLTVSKDGDGQGTVTATGSTIDCGSKCTVDVSPGALVTLTAKGDSAPAGITYKFARWTGAGAGCTTDPTCSLQPIQATTVTATFVCSGFCPESVPNQTNNLYGVWGFSDKEIVAYGASGTILKSDSVTWKSVASSAATGINLRAMHSLPGSAIGYAVGDGGAIIKTNNAGTAWSKLNSGFAVALRAVLVTSDTLIFALGDGLGGNNTFIKSIDSGTNWNVVGLGGLDYKWNAVALAQANQLIGVADAGQGALVDYSNGNTPAQVILSGAPAVSLNGVYVVSKAKMYVVGDKSTVLTSAGTSFMPMTGPAGVGMVNLHGIFGVATDVIYAVGDGGAVWKYNGMSWTVVPSGGTTMNLYGIWGSSATDFYMVGQNGTIIHYRP